MYRTRIGPFALDNTQQESSRAAEAALCAALTQWRADLVASAELQTSSLKKIRKDKSDRTLTCLSRVVCASRIYKHDQYSEAQDSNPVARDEHGFNTQTPDNFHSPMRAEEYIAARLLPKLNFYRRRIPQYSRNRIILRIILFLCTVVGSVIAYLTSTFQNAFSPYTMVVTSAAAATTSWTEFSDVDRKCERYTRATVSLQNLLSNWKSLPEVEKSSPVEINNLIRSCEVIISDERCAWVSTADKKLQDAQSETKATNDTATAIGQQAGLKRGAKVHPMT